MQLVFEKQSANHPTHKVRSFVGCDLIKGIHTVGRPGPALLQHILTAPRISDSEDNPTDYPSSSQYHPRVDQNNNNNDNNEETKRNKQQEQQQEKRRRLHFTSRMKIELDPLCALEARLRDGGASLVREFDSIARQRVSAGRSTALKNENARKNRYSNVLPYEDTRVMLRPTKTNPHGYINASNIQMPIGPDTLSYIAAQAPTKDTVGDWWQMVWESGAHLIVMLTKCQESVKDQLRDLCHPYWPTASNGGKKIKAGDFQISIQQAGREQAGRVITTLCLKHLVTGEKRSVYHLQYLMWPTSSIPDNIDSLLGFLDEVNSVRRHLDNELHKSSLMLDTTGRSRSASTNARSLDSTGLMNSTSFADSTSSSNSSSPGHHHHHGVLAGNSNSNLAPNSRRQLAQINNGDQHGSGRSTGSSNVTTSSISNSSSLGFGSKNITPAFDTPTRPPTIVHCCSGAGRTGAYILIEVMIHCLEHNQNLEVSRALSLLRQQRMHLVQSASQYKFVYMSLIEYLRNSRLI